MKKVLTDVKRINKTISEFFRFIIWLYKREIAYHQIKPREALFFLTYRCSSRCRMCQMWKRPKDYEEMDLESWKRAVDIVAQKRVKVIYLFGGDVLLRKDILFPLAEYISQKGIQCDITTNGNLLDEDTARRLIDTGVKNIGVSIDAIGDTHDDIRRVKGMFERATQGVKYMLQARGDSKKPAISIYCTISKLNIDVFHQVLPYALDLGVDQLHFEYYGEFSPEYVRNSTVDSVMANPYYQRQDESLLLNESQACYLKRKIDELERNAKERISLDIDNIDCLSINDLVKGEFQHKRCYMARYHINMDPSGNIIPCLFFQNYHLGNIRNAPFDEIWKNNRHRTFLEALKDKQIQICKHCIIGV